MARHYFFHPTGKMNQDFSMDDENKNPVYEAKAVKKGIFTAWQFEFTDHLANKTEMHKVGHTVTTEQHSGAIGLLGGVAAAAADWLSVRSWFKYDGTKIWDYLHAQGIRIDSHLAQGKIGMSYTVTLKGQELATLTMTTASGKNSLIGARFWYDVEMTGDNMELTFLTAFALAKTEQTFYD
ncbi:MAG: hypothetical protein K5897_12015 [Eubacterium sp.]|nr:hypothetical protein [Eubacterium sp.]